MQRTILVIDDAIEIARLICATAGTWNFNCTAVDTVEDLLSALRPDTSLILMDMRMPHMSGRELLGVLAESECATPILLMSGSGEDELAEAESYGRSIGLHVIGTLAKPFRVPELAAMLRLGAGYSAKD